MAFVSRFDTTCCIRAASAYTGVNPRAIVVSIVTAFISADGRASSTAPCTISPRSTTCWSRRSLPVTIRDTSSRSSMSRFCNVTARSITALACSTLGTVVPARRNTWACIRMALRGVRSSWERVARNRSFVRLEASATARAVRSSSSLRCSVRSSNASSAACFPPGHVTPRAVTANVRSSSAGLRSRISNGRGGVGPDVHAEPAAGGAAHLPLAWRARLHHVGDPAVQVRYVYVELDVVDGASRVRRDEVDERSGVRRESPHLALRVHDHDRDVHRGADVREVVRQPVQLGVAAPELVVESREILIRGLELGQLLLRALELLVGGLQLLVGGDELLV